MQLSIRCELFSGDDFCVPPEMGVHLKSDIFFAPTEMGNIFVPTEKGVHYILGVPTGREFRRSACAPTDATIVIWETKSQDVSTDLDNSRTKLHNVLAAMDQAAKAAAAATAVPRAPAAAPAARIRVVDTLKPFNLSLQNTPVEFRQWKRKLDNSWTPIWMHVLLTRFWILLLSME